MCHCVGIEKVKQRVALYWDNEDEGRYVTVLG